MADPGLSVTKPPDTSQIPQLRPRELFWRDIQSWLQEQGYMLRSRYRPDWKPSYTLDDNAYEFEDGLPIVNDAVLDATRIATDELVFEGLYFMHQCHVAHRDYFLEVYRGLEFIQPLVNEMVQDDPAKRPDMEEVVKRFTEIYQNLPKSVLRSRLAGQREANDPFTFIGRHVKYYVHTLIHILLRRNPMPTPS
ncbi:hypothetical protein ABKN59_011687 [Abortiporus biennis]